ncbi:MAG: bifunctional 4-hydroxy-2-oxoglutarate aldolase/2-dehydro-3-deoxy-phosphogluconate aldolase [Candidatus Omnitrophota bacterium]|jgi:2-dehydro-3-deoxyphosphogluconate aldolase/(4S)-4-hydroxy-2-oxoglutarate aldolase
MNVADFKKLPILGILRGIELSSVEPLVETIISSGLKTIEITMNTQGAPELIKQAQSIALGRLTIGAGTVLNLQDLEKALSAGASFIVSPVLVDSVMEYCVKNKVPVFPGALTPAEIYKAWGSGATMVKVFPAKVFGPGYFREIKGPFPNIELLACAGVTAQNLHEYLSSGASAVTFGASVFRQEWLKNKDYEKIGSAIKEFVREFKGEKMR